VFAGAGQGFDPFSKMPELPTDIHKQVRAGRFLSLPLSTLPHETPAVYSITYQQRSSFGPKALTHFPTKVDKYSPGLNRIYASPYDSN